MSLNMPTRRLLQGAASSLSPSASSTSSPASLLALQHLSISPPCLPTTQRRTLFGFGRSSKKEKDRISADLKKISKQLQPKDAIDRMRRQLRGGKIENPNIFSDEVAATEVRSSEAFAAAAGEDVADASGAAPNPFDDSGYSRDAAILARAVDPDPRGKARYLRRKVIQHVTKATNPYSRETRLERIRRTEKEIREKTGFKPTSIKKFVHLARQIAGKTVEDALQQMRYSKKKMAKEVYWHLERARDRAIVERGMGLGRAAAGQQKEGEAAAAAEPKVHKIQTKDGRHLEVTDPTTLYVAQSWIERGPWRGIEPKYRARGRRDKIQKPSTGMSFILKEQKTLIREHKEREEKKYRQGPWEHLPNRPVTAQRQHYSW